MAAGSANAQVGAKPGGAPLASGSTAAEVTLDSVFTGSLLRFSEANKAWKFEAFVNIGNVSSTTTFNLGGSVGRREYKGAGAFRPFMGFGGSLAFFDQGPASGFGIGPYVELGGAYFLTPRFSIGAASNAGVFIQNSSQQGGGSSTGFGVSASLISMMATVYF